MLILPNGHRSWFIAASGAMAWFNGWPWEQPLRWCGVYNPDDFITITKTLTWNGRVGNLKLWKWWRCIRFLPGGNVVNSVGLTNKGLTWWLFNYYDRIKPSKHRIIVSVLLEDPSEAKTVGEFLSYLPNIIGVQLNVSCPNIKHDSNADYICSVTKSFMRWCHHPVILKLGYQDDFVTICRQLDGQVAAFELINAVPWDLVYPGKQSPLHKYGLVGAVSGPVIAPFARAALQLTREAGVKGQIASGGGIRTCAEIQERYNRKANAFVFGTHFLRQITRTKQLMSWCPPPNHNELEVNGCAARW